MRFFYGADSLVIKPEFNKGNPSNDYGLGFYLTENKEMARLWATKFNHDGYLIEYDVDIKGLNILTLNGISDEEVLKWITLLVVHRFSNAQKMRYDDNIQWLKEHYSINLDGYDVIIGYRADDSYFDYSRDFISGDLSLELLKDAMRLGKLGTQFVLISEKAFSNVKYVKSEKIKKSDEYTRFRNETKMEYYKIKKEDDKFNTYLRDIMRKEDGN